MAWETIRKELAQLSALVEGWCDGKPVDTLERDLALVKLRNLYEAIRFSESAADEVAAQPKNIEVESLTEPRPEDSDAETLDLSGMLTLEPDLVPSVPDEIAEPAAASPAEPEEFVLPARPRKKPQPAASTIVSPQEPEPISASVATVASPQKPGTVPEPHAASGVEVLAKPRTETAPAEQTATLFAAEEEEDDTTRHRRKQRVIMSLYGDGQSARKADSDDGMFEEVTVKTETSDEPIWASGFSTGKSFSAPAPEPAIAVSEPAPAPAGNVLGDVINHDVRTLADTIEPPRDMASSLRRKTAISDLRQAIGINDKFLLIRDLFDGDSAAYEAAMQALNDAESIDDCMIYLTENYAWNADSEGVRLLMDLLERKFA
ncbi:MAG: hypothetical protein K2K43_07495 [Alistipes sp.]|nr:hypothetical protein [Alistipes sp.]